MKYIDMHCDTLSRLARSSEISLRKNNCHVDLERLAKADCAAQFFAIFMPTARTPDTLELFMTCVDRFWSEMEKNKDIVAFAGNAEDIQRNMDAGKISALMTVEDSGILHCRQDVLRVAYRLGVRLVTLTWNFKNAVGGPNLNPEYSVCGLTDEGIDFVAECNRLGILVDVSHLSDGGFWDVAKHSKKPFVASHSNARGVTSYPRNLTDEMLKALADAGGVAGLNFCGGFVRPRGGDMFAKFESEECTPADMAAHAMHMLKVCGEDTIAIGTDFDGIGSWPDGLGDCANMPLLADALSKAGFTQRQIDKIFFENTFRVIKEVL